MIVSKSAIDNEAVAGHYTELDRFYRLIWGEHVHHGLWLDGSESAQVAVAKMVEHVAALAQIQRGQSVCDVGSGYGATARWLARKCGAQVSALTITPRQYDYAVAFDPGATNPRYFLGDWLKNDFAPASFDAVIAIESSEHMADKERFFAEAARVLKPGGRVVVCAWLACEHPKPWESRHLLEPICREGRLPCLANQSEFRAFLKNTGFALEQFEEVSSQVARTWTICLRRLLWQLLTNPGCRRFLWDRRNRDRIFALTLPRIRIAYAAGSMRYGIFTARRTGC